MTVSSGNFAELLWPGIREIWGSSYNDWEALYRKIFTVKKSDKAFEKEQGVTGLPLASIKQQGSPIAFVDPYQGYQEEYIPVVYAIGAGVTREMYDDDQYNYISQLPKLLARSMQQTEETTHFNVLNNAFTAGVTAGADGVALASNAHPLVGGGANQSNIPDTASDLTMTSFETACTDIMDFVDEQSLKIYVKPRLLVVPTALWAIGEKILGTDRAVGSADNDINVVRAKAQLIVSPWLTDTDAFFVVTDVPNGLVSYERRAADIDRDNEFNTQNLLFTSTRRWSQGFTDHRCIYASQGA